MATKIAKEEVWKEIDPNNPKSKPKLVGADDHKPDKTYVLVARKGQKLPEENLEGIDGVGSFFGNTEAAPDVKPVPTAPPRAEPAKPEVEKAKRRSTRVTRRAKK